ncbi:MAG: ComEC/Rec2 family competence protein [Saprospiraceae bacterium]
MLNPHQLPALRVLLPLISGILIGFHYDAGWKVPSVLLAGSFVIFLLTALANSLFRTERLAKFSAFILFLALGYLACWFKLELNSPDHFSKQAEYERSRFICEVSDPPQWKENWVRVIARVSHLIVDDSISVPKDGNVLLYLERDTLSEKVEYGDRLILLKAPQRVRGNTNPDAFDYSRYLHFQNIHFQLFARKGDWKAIDSGYGNPILAFSNKSQRHLVGVLRKHLPTPDEFAVGSALLLGYRDEISDDLRQAYAQTGAMHVLAVSGLHLGIVFIILSFLFQKIPNWSKLYVVLKTVAILIGIWGFALVTGASPSVMRAATMFSLLAIGQALERTGAIYNTLMVSAIILLLINPLWLASVGFQLSYLAVFGIVYFQRRFERMIFVPKGFLRKIWTLITVSLAAQLTTGPISVFYFRQFPVFFWLSSLFLVPAAALLMTGGLLLMFVDWCAPGLAFYLGKALWAMIWLCNQIVFFIQDLPGALISDIFLTSGQTILLYLTLFTTMVYVSHKHRRSLIASSALGLIFIAFTSFTSISNHRSFELVIYDKYNASVIEFYKGRQCYRICSEENTATSLEYTVKGHHQRLGIREVYEVSRTSAASDDSLFLKTGNRILFGGLRILHLDGTTRLAPASKVKIDLIIVSDNAGEQLEQLLATVDCNKVIFDSSNKFYKLKESTQMLDKLGVEYHLVAQNGAFQKRWQIE